MENYKQNYIHKPYLFLAILFSLLSCQKEVVSKVTLPASCVERLPL